MAQFFSIHPDNPQPRLVRQAVDILRDGGVIAYPTDSGYALGCHIGDKKAQDRIRAIRQVDERHNFTLVCRDLSEISTYSKVGNAAYRLMKAATPGPYTFILKATHEVPRRLQNPKRKTIGLRVPGNPIALSLLNVLDEPLMSSTLILPEEHMPLTNAEDIMQRIGRQLDLVIDGGYCPDHPTTVIDLMGDQPLVLREGRGDVTPFMGQ